MIPCISVENMRLSDAYTIEHLVPSLELMYRAAYGVYLATAWKEPVAIVAGSGNNGGDGYALACILKEKGIDCTVFSMGRKLSADSTHYAEKARNLGISITKFIPECLFGFATVVDCLLGTGFQGQVREDYRIAIDSINASNAYVVSVDINSGMNGDTGECETSVFSDLTVTIGYVKIGLVTENAGKYIKHLVCADIGIVLVSKEGYITEKNCPSWLDMDVINAVL